MPIIWWFQLLKREMWCVGTIALLARSILSPSSLYLCTARTSTAVKVMYSSRAFSLFLVFTELENFSQLTHNNRKWPLDVVHSVLGWVFLDHRNEIYAFFSGVDFAVKSWLCVHSNRNNLKCVKDFSSMSCIADKMWKLYIKSHIVKGALKNFCGLCRGKASAEIAPEPCASVARGDFCEVTMEWMAWVMCYYCIFVWNCYINEAR